MFLLLLVLVDSRIAQVQMATATRTKPRTKTKYHASEQRSGGPIVVGGGGVENHVAEEVEAARLDRCRHQAALQLLHQTLAYHHITSKSHHRQCTADVQRAYGLGA